MIHLLIYGKFFLKFSEYFHEIFTKKVPPHLRHLYSRFSLGALQFLHIMGSVTNEIQQRRGVVEEMNTEGDDIVIISKIPVSGMFGFASAIRSATGGKVLWSSENEGYQKVPYELQSDIVAKIRTRKGLKPEPYDENYYSSL